MMSFRIHKPKILTILFVIFIICITTMRLHLASQRYFDQDEFAHLHWSWLLQQGRLPYADFFMNFTPLYFWFISIAFLAPEGPMVLIAARFIHIGLWFISLYLLFGIIRRSGLKSSAALWAVSWAAIFPMVIDKSIEIRQDSVMTTLYLGSIYSCLPHPNVNQRRFMIFLSGFLASLSFVTLFKIFYALPALIYLWWQQGYFKKHYIHFLALGIIIPPLILAIYFTAGGLFPLAYESIIHGSQVIKDGEGGFAWWRPFAPLALVYVNLDGPSIPWYISSVQWILGILGTLLLVYKRQTMGIFLLLFIACGALSLKVFPTPYLQYFIPFGFMISIGAGYVLDTIFEKFKSIFRALGTAVILTLLSYSYFLQYQDRISEGGVNTEQLKVVKDILQISIRDETVYDMVGSYVFRPNGYYVCCNVYSTFAHRLNVKIPTLADSLVSSNTKYIILDRGGKSFWLPNSADLYFLLTNYLPSNYPKIYTTGYQFDCIQNLCTQTLADGKLADSSRQSVYIKFSDMYKITTVPAGQKLTINGTTFTDGSRISLSPGEYLFSVSSALTRFTIQLDR